MLIKFETIVIAVSVFFVSFIMVLFSPNQPYALAACNYDHGNANWEPLNGDECDLDPSGAIAIAGDHYNIDNFIIQAGTNIYVQTFDGVNYGKLTINAANATIDGGLVGTGRGYSAGNGPGTGNSSYGSITAPIDMGSGGATRNSAIGGAGGGAIRLAVSGTLINNGSIVSGGNNGTSGSPSSCCPGLPPGAGYGGIGGNGASGWSTNSSGGSGGSIYITAGTFTGNGSITANGGNGSGPAGGGGGGRIAIYYNSKTYTGAATAYGAVGGNGTEYGGPGTIYLKSDSQSQGDLILDNNNNIGRETSFSPAAYTFDHLTVINGANLIIPTSGSVTTLDTGAWTVYSLTVNGSFIADSITDLMIDGIVTVNANTSMSSLVNGAGRVTINPSGVLSHLSNTNVKTNFIDWSLIDLTINAGGKIDVSGKGYSAGNGPGTGNSSYGSMVAPVDLGSGGTSHNSAIGGAGGGAVRLAVSGTLINNGSIVSGGNNGTSGSPSSCCYSLAAGPGYGGIGGNGASGWSTNSSGGSGGSIYITAGTFTGNGSITANGGNGSGPAGGGGGGRIAIYYNSKTYTGAATAYGAVGGNGTEYGGAGTIFQKSSFQGNGDLLLDNNGANGAATPTIAAINNFDTLTIQKNANLSIPSGKTLTTNDFTLANNGTFTTDGSMTTSNLAVNGNFSLNTNLSVNPTRNISFGPSAKLVIGSGAVLSHDANIDTKTNYIDWALDELIINSGGSINVDGKGYSGGNGIGGGAGAGSGDGSGGGGHGGVDGGVGGGVGGAGTAGAGGAANDSVTAPVNMGSGGGSTTGGAGGGYVKFTLGSATVNGTISADGFDGAANRGGGAGGSIWLNITRGFSGTTGAITANGGIGNGTGGGGGGGIIYISRDPTAGKLLGWARACTVFANDCSGALKPNSERGGWEGWISLNSENCDTDSNGYIDGGNCGGVDNNTYPVINYKVSTSGNDFIGWAWSDNVIGWINFDPDFGGVHLQNNSPVVTPLAPSIPDYCADSPASIQLSWNFSDHEDGLVQTAYQLAISRNDGMKYDSGKLMSAATSQYAASINSQSKCGIAPGPYDQSCAGFINYGGYAYTWTIKAWDSGNLSDGPEAGVGFNAPAHKYPQVGFTPPSPYTLLVGEPTNFKSSGNTNPSDNSVCYGAGNVEVNCSNWVWNFGDGSPIQDIDYTPPAVTNGNTTYIYNSEGQYGVTLTVTDPNGNACSNDPNTKKLKSLRPKWKEVVPQ